MKNFEEKIWRKTFLKCVWLGGEEGKQMMRSKCFLPEPTKIFSLQNEEKTEWRLRGCLVYVFKQPFSVFKQHFMYFNTLFYPHVFPQIFLNNNFQFLNTHTKRALDLACTFHNYKTHAGENEQHSDNLAKKNNK